MKILIVEDDFTCRMMMQRLLEAHGKCDVVINGKEAVEAFIFGIVEGKPYDLILLDIMMPEMDGQEVVKEVRRIEEEEWGIIYPKGIKIIMTTALDDPKNVVTAFKSLCDAYLVKPVTEQSLIAAIREFFPDFGR
ncbi:MAG TPA: response regulator [Syntrophus sp. (in: bacteria)]|jgi:two-component system chemotaxis response regulator CheY|nr:response regulator [Syntrophus sp. (in: bacteria)]